jgi:ubiquinone/menaquinone biosynthesis C-methylase UbiE
MNETQASRQGTPDYRIVGRHGVFPEFTHDETERFNFLAQMNRHLGDRVLPAVRGVFENRVAPKHAAEGKTFRTRHDVRRALLADPYYQMWSALRRATMEQRQEAGRWVTMRQAEALAEKVDAIVGEDEDLKTDPTVPVPRYVSAVDHHCMPGSYHTEAFPGDVAGAANYDCGNFVTTGGAMGRYTDGAGRGVVDWLQRKYPQFKPREILEIGATVGHTLVPIAQAYSQASVVGIDVGLPVLRYGLARARSLGVGNLRFVQADGADMRCFQDESFDLVITSMFLHELSYSSLRAVLRETYRVLRPGGIVLHIEQPQYAASMPLFEQAMRDWDGFYNNEPFWSMLHEMDLDSFMCESGFKKAELIHDTVTAIVDPYTFPGSRETASENFGRRAAWHVMGSRKTA